MIQFFLHRTLTVPIEKSLSDTLTLSETLIFNQVFNRALSDTLTITEQLLVQKI